MECSFNINKITTHQHPAVPCSSTQAPHTAVDISQHPGAAPCGTCTASKRTQASLPLEVRTPIALAIWGIIQYSYCIVTTLICLVLSCLFGILWSPVAASLAEIKVYFVPFLPPWSPPQAPAFKKVPNGSQQMDSLI